jgi:uncharacterized iron-regulated membrane protein
VRVRTVFALTTGAAFGAGSMYLLDPEHGELRRREARREAARQVKNGTVRAALDAKRRAEEVAVAAVVGYQQARAESDPPGDLHRLDDHRAS